MPRYIAFLRAINVGGRNVTMEKLRQQFEGLGFKEVETFIASGNVIFSSPSKHSALLEQKIEGQLQKGLGYEVKVFLRTDSEIAALACFKPFPESQLKEALALNIGFVATPLNSEATKAVMAMKSEIDDFRVEGREVFWLCRMKQSDSKFSNVRFEKALKARATWRNANTIARLAAKYPPASLVNHPMR
ncbi:MAG: hypothetical protein QOH88_3312 [Verrucomicrobiota bacterium]|jgi:uncharacterized protein (DUF1697 family)